MHYGNQCISMNSPINLENVIILPDVVANRAEISTTPLGRMFVSEHCLRHRNRLLHRHMARRGLYWRLRDPATPWADRVKLVRYAWCHSTIHIPNKHQVLLDWLALALTGKKRVPTEDSEAPWRCLSDMLRSQVCQTGNMQLVLRNVVGQVLLKELRGHLAAGHGSSERADHVVTCVEAVLTSHSLNTVFTSRLDTMIQLLAVSLDLCLCEVTVCVPPSSQKVALLDVVLCTLERTQWRRVNVNQVLTSTCTSLLPTAARFLSAVIHQPHLAHLTSQTHKLTTFIGLALFQKDLWEHYQLYIGTKIKSGVSTPGAALPKDAEIVFKTITTLLHAKETRNSILDFLPVFYKGFLESFKVKETRTGLHLIVLLTQLLGIDPQGEGLSEVNDYELVVTLAALFELALEHDVYSPSYGTEDNLLPWLQHLGAWLLGLTDRSVEWFDCIRHLLGMDHTSLEPRLTDILTATWVNVKSLEEAPCAAQGRLLAHLLTLYEHLRRIPAMIDRCLTALRSCTLTTPLQWPDQFSNGMVATLGALSPASCIMLWQALITELKGHYIMGDEVNRAPGLPSVVRLLSTLLLHAHFADPTTPHQVSTQIPELLSVTSRDVADVIVRAALKKSGPGLCTALSLTLACGELRLLLTQFTSLTLGGSAPGDVPCWNDLTLLHSGVVTSDWATVYQRATKRRDVQALHLVDELVMQKLRAVLLLQTENTESRRTAISNITQHLTDRLPQDAHCSKGAVWNRQVYGIDETNHNVAAFDIMCRNLALIAPFWSHDQLFRFIHLIIDVMLQPDDVTQRPSDHTTVHTLVRSLLSSTTCHELVALQSAIVTVILERLAPFWAPSSTSTKKRKSLSSAAGSLLSSLSSPDTRWQVSRGTESSDVARVLKSKSEGIADILSMRSPKATKRLSDTDMQQALALLKILEMLPLEYFLPINKTRCMLGLLVASSTNQPELVKTSLGLLIIVMDGPDLPVVVGHLDTSIVLLWLMATVDQATLSLREHVTFDLIKQSTKDLTSAERLKPFLTECSSVVSRFGKGESTSLLQMVLVAKTLGALRSVVERAHQQAALHCICVTYFTDLATKMLDLLSSHSRSQTAAVASLQCYRHSLDHVCYLTRKRHQREAVKAWRAATSQETPMEVDEKQEEDEAKVASSSGDESSAESDAELSESGSSDDVEDDGYSRKLGAALKAQLPAICEMLLHILSTGKDGSVLHSCLPLVATICTNHTQLKNHLPDDFQSRMLELVFSMRPTSDKHDDVTQGLTSKVGEEASGVLRQTAVAIIGGLSADQFSQTLHQLLRPLTVDCLRTRPERIALTLTMLQDLLDAPLDADSAQMLKFASQNVLIPVQEILAACHYMPPGAATQAVITIALSTQTKMLSYGQSLLSARSISVCLHSCQSVALETVLDLNTFAAYHQGAYEVLNAMLVHHEATVFGFIPSFTKAAKRLLTSVVLQGDQARAGLTRDDTHILITCALRVFRLFSLIATHKVNFAKVAPYMVADYIDHVQKVTIIPQVKKSLVSAVYELLDLCDEHAVRMLSTVLPPSGKEIFKVLYAEYNRYHRYQGRV